jgi:hypothetical protein
MSAPAPPWLPPTHLKCRGHAEPFSQNLDESCAEPVSRFLRCDQKYLRGRAGIVAAHDGNPVTNSPA